MTDFISWSVFEHRDHSGIEVGPRHTEAYFKDGEVMSVCTISGGRRDGITDLQRKQAAKIAAAPAMYEALKLIDADWTSEWPEGPDTQMRLGCSFSEQTLAFWRATRAALAQADGEAK